MATSRRPPGRALRCPEGYVAFVPDPLPPKLEWPDRLVAALSDADRLIGRLAGEGVRLPNPHLLMRPFLAREAVLSSGIEGTQATLGELLAAQAGAVVQRDGMLLAHTRFLRLLDGEEPYEATVRFRTVGDATCTGCVESPAATPAEVVAEVAAARVTERGATRGDDKVSEASMEDRKREGYF